MKESILCNESFKMTTLKNNFCGQILFYRLLYKSRVSQEIPIRHIKSRSVGSNKEGLNFFWNNFVINSFCNFSRLKPDKWLERTDNQISAKPS